MQRTLRRKQLGQSIAEIGAIIGLGALAVMLVLSNVGTSTSNDLCRVTNAMGANETCGSLFSENFNSLDAWQHVRGRWDLKNGQLCGGPGEGRIFTSIDGNNYRVKIDKSMLHRGNGYGVFFRTQNVEKVSGYSFQYDPGYGAGEFVIRKWVNGYEISRPIARGRAPANYDWYDTNRTIELDVNGDTFTAYVDGEPVVTATDSTYPEGGIGFRTWSNTRACFDDITVEAIP